MTSVHLGGLVVEDDVGAAGWAMSTEVLLAEALDLLLNGRSLLQVIVSTVLSKIRCDGEMAYKLFSKGDLLELHLVNSGLGGAEQRSCCEKGALHLGRQNLLGESSREGKLKLMRSESAPKMQK